MEPEKLIDYIIRILVLPAVGWGIWTTKAVFELQKIQAVAEHVKDSISEKISEAIKKLDKIDERLRNLEQKNS